MTVEHKSLRDEVLFIIGRATAPLDGSEIYERATLADEMRQVSNAIFQLKAAKKIGRVEGEGRARYTLAKGTAALAPAGKAGRPAADPGLSLDGAAGGARRAPDAPVTGIRPALSQSPEMAAMQKIADHFPDAGKKVEVSLSPGAAKLADAIIAESRGQLAPTLDGGPQWWIDQDGCLEISDRGDNGILVEFTREEARRMAEMIVATHDVLEQLA
ncbi:MAG: hypothetical protein ACYCZT_10570 [Thiobacillus sp.]